MSTKIKGLQKLRTFDQGMDLNKFMQTEFRQNMRALERSINDPTTADGLLLFKTDVQTMTADNSIITFNEVNLDPESLYENGTITIQRPGRYDISSCLVIAANLSASQAFGSLLFVNDEARILGRYSYGNGAFVGHRTDLNILNYRFEQSDRITLRAFSNVSAALITSFNQCFFSLKFVGL